MLNFWPRISEAQAKSGYLFRIQYKSRYYLYVWRLYNPAPACLPARLVLFLSLTSAHLENSSAYLYIRVVIFVCAREGCVHMMCM